jgi:hypothetical protein
MRLAAVSALLVLISLGEPALAQSIDFGDDGSRWSNDGECDDPRFEGPGMTQTPLLDTDIGHDATDCQGAFNAGQIVVVGGSAPVKGHPAPLGFRIVDGINFGDDTGDWNSDGECDDRRFFGVGMAVDLSWDHIGRDASDCLAAYQKGTVRLWDYIEARQATVCAAIDFGNDLGAYPGDYECDDRRFEGPGAAMSMRADNEGGDASDCIRLCEFGAVFLRDY